jgi:hypothetical protein
VGGEFTAVGGVSASNIARWNGSSWEALGAGVNSDVYSLAVAPNGDVYAGGTFTSAGDVTLGDRVAVWNGSTWNHLDVDLPGSPEVQTLLIDDIGIYLGFSTTGTATTSYTNTVTNNGTASAYPIITVKRSGGTSAIVEWIKNETTGKRILVNYSLQDGETLTIDLRPGRREVTSSYYGDVWRAILRGSDFADFSLLPGSNLITVLVANTGATVTPTMRWRPTYWSTDGVA